MTKRPSSALDQQPTTNGHPVSKSPRYEQPTQEPSHASLANDARSTGQLPSERPPPVNYRLPAPCVDVNLHQPTGGRPQGANYLAPGSNLHAGPGLSSLGGHGQTTNCALPLPNYTANVGHSSDGHPPAANYAVPLANGAANVSHNQGGRLPVDCALPTPNGPANVGYNPFARPPPLPIQHQVWLDAGYYTVHYNNVAQLVIDRFPMASACPPPSGSSQAYSTIEIQPPQPQGPPGQICIKIWHPEPLRPAGPSCLQPSIGYGAGPPPQAPISQPPTGYWLGPAQQAPYNAQAPNAYMPGQPTYPHYPHGSQVIVHPASNGAHTIPAPVIQPDVAPRLQPRDLSRFSAAAWHAINTDYCDSRGSKEYENAHLAIDDVESCIESIRDAAIEPGTPFETKRSAIETLRKIGKTICLSTDVIGSEVRKHFQGETGLEDALLAIIRPMELEEVKSIALTRDEKGQFLEKMKALTSSAKNFCILDGLEEVSAIMQSCVDGHVVGDGDEESEDDDENDEEDNEDVDGEEDDAESYETRRYWEKQNKSEKCYR